MGGTVPIARMQHGHDQTYEIVKHLRREVEMVEADYAEAIGDDTLDKAAGEYVTTSQR